jgi:hypothetical protein
MIEQRDFIPYPTNCVAGTVTDVTRARAAVDALLEAGFVRDDIEILYADDGVHRLDPKGEEHGFLAQFQRTPLRNLAQVEEYKHLMHHVEDLRAGRFVIMVLARKRDKRQAAAHILSAHGAESIGFYGKWAWQGFTAAR